MSRRTVRRITASAVATLSKEGTSYRRATVTVQGTSVSIEVSTQGSSEGSSEGVSGDEGGDDDDGDGDALVSLLLVDAAFATFSDVAPRRTSGIGITLRRLTAGEKPRKIYISYAWGDDSPEGQIRTEAVEGLCSALEADGFLPFRDRDRIHPGDQISAFINRLTRADLVVAVISDKYLRSPYCMYEIYKLWQRVQTDAADLAQCLVPVVLPDVSFKNVRERLVYMEYWAEEADSLEALVRNPKLKPSRESWEEVRLVREFAHHVDDILVFLNDVLMERRLEVHLENGFEAVREALRRRMGERG